MSVNGEWSINLKNLLDSLGKLDLLNSHSVVSVDGSAEQLDAMFNKVWCSMVENKPKLRTFKQIKPTYCVEPYLRVNVHKWKRTLISWIRCGVLALRIETGRAKCKAYEERICELC